MGAAAAVAELVGCGGSGADGSTDGTSDADSSGSSGPQGTDSLADSSAATITASGDSAGTGTSSIAETTAASEDSSAGATGSGTTDDTGAVACEPSPGSIEGPFYRPDIPVRSDLDLYDDAGAPLHLSGRVVDSDCAPVVGAIIELWHAAPSPPDAMPGDVDATYDASREYRYYGQVATDREGRYAFDTLRPGWYLNGNNYRPAHLHVKIWVDDVERLTTQLYFADDPFNADDPWFDATMELDPTDTGDATHDFAV